MTTKYPITLKRKKELENQLDYLKNEELKKINEDIKYYRSFCNFTEDTPFDESLDKQFEIKKQIQEIEDVLSNSEVKHSKDSLSEIQMGNEVTIKELPDGALETYTLVSPIESDPFQQKLSIKSPIGKNLLGHEINDKVFIETPAGGINIKIIDIQ